MLMEILVCNVIERERWTERKTDRKKERQTDREKERQTDKGERKDEGWER